MNDARPSHFRLSSPHRDCDTGEWTARSRTVESFEAIDDLDSRSVVIPNPFGRYAIDRLLGQGSMGAVFLAYDEYLQRQVALKIPLFRDDAAGLWKVRFLREARAVANLRHPNICPVFDAGETQGILYLTMAYIEGSPLSALMVGGPRKQEEVVELVRTLARAMLVAHSMGTLHRDLKPANILIDSNGQPVIMDFGLARRAKWSDEPATSVLAQELGVTQFGSLLGTLPYMPPEQARGDLAALGPWSDVYSLGVILYELLTNRLPFTAETVQELVHRIEYESPTRPAAFYPWLNGPLEAVCLKALAKNPIDRYQTMGEFERALPEAVEVHAQ
jgi:serine/threonine protein kinase